LGRREKDKIVESNAQDEKLVKMVFTTLGCHESLTHEFIKISLEDIRTFDRKQHDYGSTNISETGEIGVLIRVNDKMARLKNLNPLLRIQNRLEPIEAKNESIEDSWRDGSVYCVIARMLKRGVWK
jgi:hypothetical protein